ncbi:hypothetical protein Nmel_009098 [Mimus melanotis]
MQLSKLLLLYEHIISFRTIHSTYIKARQTVNFLCLQYPVLYMPMPFILNLTNTMLTESTQLLGQSWVDLALQDSPPYSLSPSHLPQSLHRPDFQCSGKQG